MSKLNFSNSKFSRFLSSKGFYVALAICLVGAGTATWFAVDRTLSGIESNNAQILENDQYLTDFPKLEEAENKVETVPKPSKPSASSQAASPLPNTPSKPSEPSAQQTESPKLPDLPKPVYALPVRGDIINPYSNGELVKNVTLNDWRTHDGVDIRAEKGSEIMATADGVVESVVNDTLWGTVITINHADGNQSIYCGLDRNVLVAAGDDVMVRQVIGTIDSIPCESSDDSHLHFAMKRDGKWIDPLSVITKA